MDGWSLTNKNLSERILETERARKQSVENLETTNQDLTNMDYNLKLLKKAVEEKNPSKMVAESRLEVSLEEEKKHLFTAAKISQKIAEATFLMIIFIFHNIIIRLFIQIHYYLNCYHCLQNHHDHHNQSNYLHQTHHDHVPHNHDHDHQDHHHHDQVRSHRPGQEHCGDKAFVKLREEVS